MNSIFHRISVRKYEDKPVEKEKIMEILKAGMQAPSACNQQPWEFYVVTDKEKIQKLSKVTPYTGCAAGAPAVIVPVYHTEGLVAPSFAQIDMSIAQENIWLETDTLGLGGVWFGIAPVEEHMEKVHRLLDLPENVKVCFSYRPAHCTMRWAASILPDKSGKSGVVRLPETCARGTNTSRPRGLYTAPAMQP